MRFFRTFLKAACAVLAAGLSMSAAAAWPERTVTLIAPYPAGGNADAMARLVAKGLSARIGQPVIVENKPGAGGMLGSQYVARAKPDGYTFLLGALSNVLNEFTYKRPLLDLRKDLVPVSQVASIPNYFAAGLGTRFANLADLIAEAKAKPGKLTCATSGVGTSGHLACEMLKQRTGANVLIVPYKGGAPAITDVLGGHATFLAINEVLPYIRDKRLTGLAVTSAQRSPMAPELPPAAETIPGFELVSWYGVFAPTGTPPEIVAKVSTAIGELLKSKESIEQLKNLGASPVGTSPKEFSEFVQVELDRWEKIIKPLNIALD
ncbi:MAG TPA: tripartite tricarboxylate transporter substrate binding protein [Burkholderiaceae bacterium]|nr:tripartite tricarboxylate transporter substrate binding protein [Burkholderiaceae bacterium]